MEKKIWNVVFDEIERLLTDVFAKLYERGLSHRNPRCKLPHRFGHSWETNSM
jgi:hypothetical protein